MSPGWRVKSHEESERRLLCAERCSAEVYGVLWECKAKEPDPRESLSSNSG